MKRAILSLSLASLMGVIGCESMKSDSAEVTKSTGDTGENVSSGKAPSNNPLKNADPQMSVVLAALESLGGKPIETLTPAEARKQPSMTDAVMKVMKDRGMDTAPDPAVTTTNTSLEVQSGKSIKVRIYRPADAPDANLPVVVYFHGGGWVLADLDTYDASCREMSKMANCLVVSVDYRKAPENKFTTAHDDCYDALEWVLGNGTKLKGDQTKVAVMGESAGGNMAAAACIKAKWTGAALPVAQILVYPVAGDKTDTPSYLENAVAKPLNRAMMSWFFDKYLNNPSDGGKPWINLVGIPKEKLAGLPPATVICDQIDPLRSEGEMFATHLKEAGVPTEERTFSGVTHEFFGAGKVLDKAMEAETMAADALKKAFSKM